LQLTFAGWVSAAEHLPAAQAAAVHASASVAWQQPFAMKGHWSGVMPAEYVLHAPALAGEETDVDLPAGCSAGGAPLAGSVPVEPGMAVALGAGVSELLVDPGEAACVGSVLAGVCGGGSPPPQA
jgi:hypothetical protein